MNKLDALMVCSLGALSAPVEKLLEEHGFHIHLNHTWEEAERVYRALPSERIKFIFIDVTLCQGNGWEKLMQRVRAAASDLTLICFHPQLPQSLYRLFDQPSTAIDSEPQGTREMHSIVGESPEFRNVLTLASRYAQHDITVLITGETGTGKEVIAHHIHNESRRKDKPFVACNMTAIPETLVESELFGYVKGAFTGAERNKQGLIESAEGGTLFLDEIGELPLNIQLKLLRFLESREFYKVGESSPKTADLRIVAATNKDLDLAIMDNGFRKDLYYRLNSARIILPPLRERREDIILLVANFVYQTSHQTQKALKKISSAVKALFLDYSWPGNIRELKSVIESAVMVSDGDYLTLSDLPMNLQKYATGHRDEIGPKAIQNIEDAEKTVIEETLRQTQGNKLKAARALGVSVRTLYRKLEKYGMGVAA
ncbi:MAG: sigma-54 interaction domain-containing protein [Candidatus Binatia bacterium]